MQKYQQSWKLLCFISKSTVGTCSDEFYPHLYPNSKLYNSKEWYSLEFESLLSATVYWIKIESVWRLTSIPYTSWFNTIEEKQCAE